MVWKSKSTSQLKVNVLGYTGRNGVGFFVDVPFHQGWLKDTTPKTLPETYLPKTDIAPENRPFQKKSALPTTIFCLWLCFCS